MNCYIDWWLEGGSVPLNDINQIFEDTGILDSIDTIPRAERNLFVQRFTVLWFALLRVSCLPGSAQTIWPIITRNSSGTPDFDGLDLWLQRRAALAVYDQQGLAPFLSEFQLVRSTLFQFIAAARIIKAEEMNAFLKQVAILDENNYKDFDLNEWPWADDL